MPKHKCGVFDPANDNAANYAYAHAKYDGHYTEFKYNSDNSDSGQLRVYSSLGIDLTDKLVNWFAPAYRTFNSCGSFSIYGELCVDGQPASFVKTAIKQRLADLRFVAFAVDFLEPDKRLSVVHATCNSLGFEFAEWIRILPNSNILDIYDALRDKTKLFNLEGVVLKNGNLLDWRKWKPVKTIDCVITGVTEGNGKYLGLIGALECSVIAPDAKLRVIATCSGITDELRVEISANERDYVGRVAEIEYHAIGSQGRLIHPRFKQWRDDKLVTDCTYKQDPELIRYFTNGNDKDL